jgi:hypothetical protein
MENKKNPVMQQRILISWQIVAVIFFIFISCTQSKKKQEDSTKTDKENKMEIQQPEVVEKKTEDQSEKTVPATTINDIRLDTILGAWIRPDGNYVLEFTEINEDNTLVANYFNPRPIKISLAQIKEEDRLKVYIEFDDVNYRGSYYDLQYDPVNDALTGNYYQATYGQTYSIAFIRYDPDK